MGELRRERGLGWLGMMATAHARSMLYPGHRAAIICRQESLGHLPLEYAEHVKRVSKVELVYQRATRRLVYPNGSTVTFYHTFDLRPKLLAAEWQMAAVHSMAGVRLDAADWEFLETRLRGDTPNVVIAS